MPQNKTNAFLFEKLSPASFCDGLYHVYRAKLIAMFPATILSQSDLPLSSLFLSCLLLHVESQQANLMEVSGGSIALRQKNTTVGRSFVE